MPGITNDIATKPTRYVLAAVDGRMATYDTRTGPALTGNRALSYVWTEEHAAESQRIAYETALGVSLSVKPQPPQEAKA